MFTNFTNINFFRGITILVKLSVLVKWYTRKNMTIPKLFAENVRKYPNRPCFVFEEKTWTYSDVDHYSNAIANYFLERGCKKDDTIALFMETRPEYVCFWLGFAKIGVKAALINFNLRDKALAHCLQVSEAKVTVFGGELSQGIITIFFPVTSCNNLVHLLLDMYKDKFVCFRHFSYTF